MEPAQLQLVFNVVAITGVSSLASFCYLLRKENRKLAAGIQVEPKHEKPRDTGAPALAQPTPAVVPAAPTAPGDMRLFAAHRRSEWVDGMTSAMPHVPRR